MVMKQSTMLALGTPAPDFSLLEPRTGKTLSLADVAGEKGLLVAIICNHCPFVKLITQQLGQLGSHLTSLSVGMVGISANDSNNYPEDAPSEMASIASSVWSTFPYLYDESQNVAKAYQAACTPDFFLFDKDMKLCYRGQLDDSRPGNGKESTGLSIRTAVDFLIRGEQMPESSMNPAIGCSIKWIPGNQPEY